MNNFELRPYQKDIVNQVINSDKSTLIQVPTGGGKTVIAHEIIKQALKEGLQILFVAPTTILMDHIKGSELYFSEFQTRNGQFLMRNAQFHRRNAPFLTRNPQLFPRNLQLLSNYSLFLKTLLLKNFYIYFPPSKK